MARWPGRAETHREKAAFLFACIKSTAFSLLRKPKNGHSALPFPQLVSRAGRGSRRLKGTSSRLLLRVAPTAQASPTLSVSNVSIMPGRRLHQSLPRVYNASDQNKTKQNREYTVPASGREPSPIGPAQSLERPNNAYGVCALMECFRVKQAK
jgi:hypothetical protein